MKKSPGTGEVPGERAPLPAVSGEQLTEWCRGVRGSGTRERDESFGHASSQVRSGIPAQRAELIGREIVPVVRIIPHAANGLGRFEDQAVAATRRRNVR